MITSDCHLKINAQQQSLSIGDVAMEFDLKTRMRDGVRLSTDVYRPRGKGKWPVILIRTPYNNSDDRLVDFGKRFASWGYAVAIQDVRGRHDSEGEWYPSKNEGSDGYDTLRWLNRQPWSNRKVGMTGGSYSAMVQWDVAILRPPSLKAMVSMVCPSDLFINCWYRRGTLVWGDAIRWISLVDGRVNQNLLAYTLPGAYRAFPEIMRSLPEIYQRFAKDFGEIFNHLPLTTVDKALGRYVKFWHDWLLHQSYDSYWKERSYHGKYSRIDVPVLHITGWYDDCADGNIQNYLGMKSSASSLLARRNQFLVVGPWPHGINVSRKYGDIDFGPAALIDLEQLQRRWFDYWLKGHKNGIVKEKPVSIFVMGANKWREESEWPLKRTRLAKLFLHSHGRANSLRGNGWLNKKPPAESEAISDEFDYDPDDPCPSAANINEPDDRRPAERRDDTLIYDSELLGVPIEVTGRIMVELFASSSARDTDFAAHLVDVFPNGYAHPVADGIITARYRDSLERPSLIEPGEIYRYRIDLWHTSNLFREGHRIRLEISSADFPRYARNMNTGKLYGADSRGIVAHQVVFHDQKHPSNVRLPVVGQAKPFL